MSDEHAPSAEDRTERLSPEVSPPPIPDGYYVYPEVDHANYALRVEVKRDGQTIGKVMCSPGPWLVEGYGGWFATAQEAINALVVLHEDPDTPKPDPDPEATRQEAGRLRFLAREDREKKEGRKT